MFIVFEGIEGSGKSTQALMLYNRLRSSGIDVILSKEPGGTRIGEEIRRILLSPFSEISPLTELLFFLADRNEHIEKVIKPALKYGKIVISDRYYYSTIAYQIGGRGMEENIVIKLNQMVVKNIIPDVVIYLDIPPEVGLLRKRKTDDRTDRIEMESLEFHNRVREEYIKLSKKEKNFITIDATKSPEKIHNEILKNLSKNLCLKNIGLEL